MIRRVAVFTTLAAMLGLLALSFTNASAAPVGSSSLPESLDLNGASLRFDAVGQTVEPSSLVEAPMSVGQELVYRSVVTVDGHVVDAVVQLVAVNNLVNGQADITDENDSNPMLTGGITADENASATTPGQVRYRISFYYGGTYTAPGTGTPVALVGLRVHVYDIDSSQFVELGGFVDYTLSTNTILTVSAGSSGRTRFAETNNISTSSSNGTAFTRGRASVNFGAVQSFEYVYGVVEADDSASYDIDLSANGNGWTDNVGGVAAPAVPNPTLTLAAVGPSVGQATGGERVTLTGAGFVPGTTVRIGGAPCTDVVIVSASSLTCTSPPGTGTVDVSVSNADESSATLPGSFTYVVPSTTTTTTAPTTTAPAATPTTTPAAAAPGLVLTVPRNADNTLNGPTISLSGEGLQPGSTVTVRLVANSAVLGTVTVGDDGTFTAVVPAPVGLPAGTYEVLAEGTAADGTPVAVRASFVVAGQAQPSELAFTGWRSGALVGAALVLTLTGVALIIVARRSEAAVL